MAYRHDRNGRAHDRDYSPDRHREHTRAYHGARSREHSPEYAKSTHARPKRTSFSQQTAVKRPLISQSNQAQNHTQQQQQAARHTQHPSHIPLRHESNTSRPRWPPRQRVEDAARGEKHILGAPVSSDDPPNRGTIDQDPLLIDMPFAKPASVTSNVPNSGAAKMWRETLSNKRDSKFDSHINFTATPSDLSSTSTAESGYHSTDKAKNNRDRTGLGEETLTDAWLENSRRKLRETAGDYIRPVRETNSAAVSDDEGSNVSSQGSRAPAKYAGVGAGMREVISPRPDPSLELHSSKRRPVEAPQIGPSSFSRRNTENSSATRRPRLDDPSRAFVPAMRDPPPPASRAYVPDVGGHLNAYASGPHPHPHPQSPSPPSSSPNAKSSPPSSRRHSREMPIPKSGASSPLNGSRPSSPLSGQPPALRFDEGIRRASTFPIVPDDRTQKTSRLATSSISIDQIDSPVTSPHRPSLPYPTDDMLIMPSAADFAYKPRDLEDPMVPRVFGDDNSLQREVNPRPSIALPVRPRLETRSTQEGFQIVAGASLVATPTHPSPPATPRRPPSPYNACLGSPGKADFHEWYFLPETSVVNICPHCAETKVSKSSFASKIEKRERTHHDPSLKCCFTSKWQELAWSIAQAERARDLNLLASIARIDREAKVEHHAHACPGPAPRAGKWMVLRGRQGEKPVPFFICALDARKIAKLLPELKHEFEEYHSRHKEVCALHEESHRFEKFTKQLVAIDAEAHRKKRAPDMTEFVQLARILYEVAPCTRDAFVRDARWHFSPLAPSLTVCPECYTTVVWPEVHSGSHVAKRIADTEQTVEREHQLGLTCQLWSPRMLTLFAKAVKNNDFKTLAEQAEERAAVERLLRKEWLELDRRAVELDRPGTPNREAKLYDLQRARHDLVAEWRKYE